MKLSLNQPPKSHIFGVEQGEKKMDETRLHELVAYFRKRSAENKKRGNEYTRHQPDREQFDARADVYARCASKLEEVLQEIGASSSTQGSGKHE